MFIPPGEKIVETKKCRLSGKEFFVTDKDLEFYDKVSPIFLWKKYTIPSPTLCPEERMRRRISYRNQRNVYLRKSSFSGETIFSMHSTNKAYPVYENDIYYSDQWNPLEYGLKYNPDISIFEQINSLALEVPHFARSCSLLENSDYCNNANNLKDSYLSFNGWNSEKLYYTAMFVRSEMCIDCLSIYECRESYECIDCNNSERCFYGHALTRCSDCFICDSCTGCNDCFSCANLVNRSYCIANKQYTKEDYFKQLQTLDIPSLVPKVRAWIATQPKRYFEWVKVENSIGNHIVNVSDVYHCFECSDCEKLRYCTNIKTGKNLMDVDNFWWNPEWCYECCVVGHNVQNLLFCADVWKDVADVLYSQDCNSIQNCFWCVWLHNHEHHCILNTSYSVHEYETLAWGIIDAMRHEWIWGEFFSIADSPWWYNESLAQEYFPMTKEEVQKNWWHWYDEPIKSFEGASIIPLSISEYDEKIVGFETAQKNIDDLLGSTLICEVTWKPFKIIKQELVFYIEHSLPIPTKHHDQRHKERMVLRNPRTFFERTCAECQKPIITTYAPERPEKVLCEECYRKNVY